MRRGETMRSGSVEPERNHRLQRTDTDDIDHVDHVVDGVLLIAQVVLSRS